MIESDIEVEATFNGILLGKLRKEVQCFAGVDRSSGNSWTTSTFLCNGDRSPLDRMREVIRELASETMVRREIEFFPAIDGFVMSRAVHQALKLKIPKDDANGGVEFFGFASFRIWVYDTEEEADREYRSLKAKGMRVVRVIEERKETSE